MFDFDTIANKRKTYVIAEIGANHNGNMKLARELILSAKNCGADAVKFQSWSKTSLFSQHEYDQNTVYTDSKKKHFGSLEEMVEKYCLTSEQHYELKAYCDEIGVDFCSSPFSNEEVDLLEHVGVPFYKIASCDINNWSLLRYVASKKKPIIVSTGMSDLAEVSDAVRILEEAGAHQIILLHCIAIYPPKNEDIHLNNIPMLAQSFNYPVGFSDHSIGSVVPLAAMAVGAVVIEKHFTLDKGMEGWDHEISADPAELKEICAGANIIHTVMGGTARVVTDAEIEKRKKFRRSIVSKRPLKAGHVLTEDDMDYKRPGTHISPNLAEFLVGRTLKNDLGYDQLVCWSDLV
ncbi:N-acetylneuraminate synthase family protein [Kordiimonas aquimaris]|uniref:N-acetylneuraminate synthase family protein n=1 Tax=Kordiimonas aquimaris TaxID=707591 RepID=UPI0021CEF2CC|nr:N-acetylneuraminate synthase family protein [Kordiimonas aquimaris]